MGLVDLHNVLPIKPSQYLPYLSFFCGYSGHSLVLCFEQLLLNYSYCAFNLQAIYQEILSINFQSLMKSPFLRTLSLF